MIVSKSVECQSLSFDEFMGTKAQDIVDRFYVLNPELKKTPYPPARLVYTLSPSRNNQKAGRKQKKGEYE